VVPSAADPLFPAIDRLPARVALGSFGNFGVVLSRGRSSVPGRPLAGARGSGRPRARRGGRRLARANNIKNRAGLEIDPKW
jgi:hypothetical protein